MNENNSTQNILLFVDNLQIVLGLVQTLIFSCTELHTLYLGWLKWYKFNAWFRHLYIRFGTWEVPTLTINHSILIHESTQIRHVRLNNFKLRSLNYVNTKMLFCSLNWLHLDIYLLFMSLTLLLKVPSNVVYIEDITRWSEDMNFIFEWQNNILWTSAASE